MSPVVLQMIPDNAEMQVRTQCEQSTFICTFYSTNLNINTYQYIKILLLWTMPLLTSLESLWVVFVNKHIWQLLNIIVYYLVDMRKKECL